MSVRYFDLHCDTAGAAFRQHLSLNENDLRVDLNRMSRFAESGAFFAVWSVWEEHLSPFAYVRDVIDFARKDIGENAVITTPKDYKNARQTGKPTVVFTVEGGDALEGNIDNIRALKEMGVSLLTLTWNGENELGFGSVVDGGEGLKPFGKQVIAELERNSVIADVSHLNDAGFKDLCRVAQRPFIATHSNAYDICRNPRNLKPWQIRAIADVGGVIGLNVYSAFLAEDETQADEETLLRHASHIMDAAKSDEILCIGTDFDGMVRPLPNYDDISSVARLGGLLTKAFGAAIADKILYKNAIDFFDKY